MKNIIILNKYNYYKYELYLSIAAQLSLKKWTFIISQFLWVRNSGQAWLDGCDAGFLWGCSQDVSWGYSPLKAWLWLEDVLSSSLKWTFCQESSAPCCLLVRGFSSSPPGLLHREDTHTIISSTLFVRSKSLSTIQREEELTFIF